MSATEYYDFHLAIENIVLSTISQYEIRGVRVAMMPSLRFLGEQTVPTVSTTYRYLRLRVSIRRIAADGKPARDSSRPSPLTSPRLRRVLGKALVDGFCPYGKPRCQPRQGRGPMPAPRDLCRLAEVCPYGVVYAAGMGATGTGVRPPFALYVPPVATHERTALIELTLFGPAWGLYPWILGALDQALRIGLGAERQAWKISAIHRVDEERCGERVCGGDLSHLAPALEPELLRLELTPDSTQPVTVELLSPTRLIRGGRLLPSDQSLPLSLLLGRILDRVGGLYGAGSNDFLLPNVRSRLEAEAAEVPLLEDHTRWIEVPDYSARHRSELCLGGRVGRLVYGTGAARFLPILRAGEVLHVGKNVASGCGRLRADSCHGNLTP